MNDTPKKKAAPRKPKPTAENVQTQKAADEKDDAALKADILEAALPHAAFDGFTEKVLQNAGEEEGLEKGEIARLFPEGPLGLIAYYSQSVDAEMQTRLAAMDLPSMKIRLRISEAVKVRLLILKRHKEAARRAAAALSLPMHTGLAAKLMYRTVDIMWRAAGDASTDFNFYTKRGILAGVYAATLVRWFADASPDEAVTNEFLAARIENVMQFEKFKAKAKDMLSNFSAFADRSQKKAP
jgi:ubiquinone biosynthesis protein COQ9